jgi:hypothetical protein
MASPLSSKLPESASLIPASSPNSFREDAGTSSQVSETVPEILESGEGVPFLLSRFRSSEGNQPDLSEDSGG